MATTSNIPISNVQRTAFMSPTPPVLRLSLLVLGYVQIREFHGVEQFIDLLVREQLLLPDDLDDALPTRVGLLRQLGRLLVSENRIERGHDADGGRHVAVEDLLVDRDPIDALR